MSQVELSSFSLSELKALQKQVAKAIEEFSDKEKARALAALEEKARELGFSLAELTGGRKGARKTAGIAKYRHPDDASVTCDGRIIGVPILGNPSRLARAFATSGQFGQRKAQLACLFLERGQSTRFFFVRKFLNGFRNLLLQRFKFRERER